MTHDSHVAKTATVKNLFDSGLAGDTKQRIMELHHHSQRMWGKSHRRTGRCALHFWLRDGDGRYQPQTCTVPCQRHGPAD